MTLVADSSRRRGCATRKRRHCGRRHCGARRRRRCHTTQRCRSARSHRSGPTYRYYIPATACRVQWYLNSVPGGSTTSRLPSVRTRSRLRGTDGAVRHSGIAIVVSSRTSMTIINRPNPILSLEVYHWRFCKEWDRGYVPLLSGVTED